MKRGRNQRRRPSGGNPNRALDSNGPDVRIRGTANQIYDKYQALARDASSSGDRIKTESYLQHAEHYFRLIRATQANQPSQQQSSSQDSDSDQPSVSDDDQQDNAQNSGRGNGRDNNNDRDQPRRSRAPRSNGAAANDSPASDSSASGDGAANDGKVEAAVERTETKPAAPAEVAAEAGEEEKKPRRRRATRKSVKKADDGDADVAKEKSAAAAE